jgi:hypothetical protein
MERVEQAVRRRDEIHQAADARRVRKDYPARSVIEAIDEEVRAIMRGKYDKT